MKIGLENYNNTSAIRKVPLSKVYESQVDFLEAEIALQEEYTNLKKVGIILDNIESIEKAKAQFGMTDSLSGLLNRNLCNISIESNDIVHISDDNTK